MVPFFIIIDIWSLNHNIPLVLINFIIKNSNLLIFGFLIAFASGFGQTFFISLFSEDFRETFNTNDCLAGNFNGRIPWFDPEGKSGTITYKIQSFGFAAAIQNNTRIKFSVMDREGNRSNEVFTREFFLQDITL